MMTLLHRFLYVIPFLLTLFSCHSSWEKTQDGIIVQIPQTENKENLQVRLQVITDRVIHVSATPSDFSADKNMLVELPTEPKSVSWKVTEQKNSLLLETAFVKTYISKLTGEVLFKDKEDHPLLRENAGGKTFTPATVDGTKTYHIHQVFESMDDEAFYALNQYQVGDFNYKGENVTLHPGETSIHIPFLLSNKNYGILWNNSSLTKLGDIRDYEQLSQFKLYDLSGEEGGLGVTYYADTTSQAVFAARKEDIIDYENPEMTKNFPAGFPSSGSEVVWEGYIQAKDTGFHRFQLYYGGYVNLWIDGVLMTDSEYAVSNPSVAQMSIHMDAGRHHSVRLEWLPNGEVPYIGLKALSPVDPEEQERLSLYSVVGDRIDYFFIAGESMDDVINGYRLLTEKTQQMPHQAKDILQPLMNPTIVSPSAKIFDAYSLLNAKSIRDGRRLVERMPKRLFL